jgi:predicted DNA-binding transcriptional regulator AlpA
VSAQLDSATTTTSKLLTPEQVAERYGVKKPWVYARSREWMKSNGRRGIPTVKLGRYYRYREEALAEFDAQVERGEAEA